MTDQLKDRFAALTDARPEPVDPVIGVRQAIARRRRRRQGAVVALCAAATVAAVIAVPALGSWRSSQQEPGVAGFAAPTAPTAPTASPAPTTATASLAPQSPGAPDSPRVPETSGFPSMSTAPPLGGDHRQILPAPWSAEVFTKMPDANAFRPKAYYIAKGKISTESWAILAFSRQGCLVTDEGPANSFGTPYVCFDPPNNGKYHVVQGHTKEKSSIKLDATLVMGSAPITARSVRVKAGGKTYSSPAVATPATDKLRFFALVIPKRDLKVTAVEPLNAAGKVVR